MIQIDELQRHNLYTLARQTTLWPSIGARKISLIPSALERSKLINCSAITSTLWRAQQLSACLLAQPSFNICFGHSMTSEVKGHLNKVMDKSLKYLYKNFRKNIMNYSWYRSFKSYDFILNDFIEKNVCKGHSFNNFFGHSLTSEVKGHVYRVVHNYVKCMCKKFRKNIINIFMIKKLQKLWFHIE